MKISIFSAAFILFIAFVGLSFMSNDQSEPWPVPDSYNNKKNTVKFDEDLAEDLWSQHCKSCHGKEGLGDGSKAAQLDTPSGDFTTDAVQNQPDGALFYKTLEGRGDMPSYKKKIPDQDDIWQLVHLMRTFE